MIKAIKVRLYPTKIQKELMFKSAGIARFSYNWGLDFLNKYYEENKKILSIGELRKESSFPRFKKKGKCEVSFFHLNNKFIVKDKYIKLEKIGYVKMKDEGRLPLGNYKRDKIKVLNPRIKFNGRFGYLSLSLKVEDKTDTDLTNESIGVDLGIKDLAIVSNIDKPFKNINKSKEVKRLNKKLKRLQKQVSRKYDMLKSGNTFKKGEKLSKTQNIIKIEKQIKIVQKKLQILD